MLIKTQVDHLNPSTKKYIFIELHPEDWRGSTKYKSIAYRAIEIGKKVPNTAKRNNVLRFTRDSLTEDNLNDLIYLDKVSTRYKVWLLRNNFNYEFRRFNDFTSKRKKKFIKLN